MPATDRSLSTKSLYDFVFYIALVIFLLVEGLIIYSAFRFRRKPGDDELPPQTTATTSSRSSGPLIPTVIVGILFVLSWQTLNVVDATVKTDVHVRAVAARFQWSFEYLDGPAPDAPVLFEQVIPTGDGRGPVPCRSASRSQVDLRSKDVIHAFYVPKFLFKRDVVPGKLNTFDFTIDDAGTYRGQCAELCGSGHARDGVRRQRRRPVDVQRLAAEADRRGRRDAGPGAVGPAGASGQPGHRVSRGHRASLVVGPPSISPRRTSRSRRTPSRRRPTSRSRSTSTTRTPGVAHNVAIHDASGAEIFKGRPIITGPAKTAVRRAGARGRHLPFVCSVHPSMTGTLTVQ